MKEQGSMADIRILLVEDSPTLRELLTHIVNSDPRLQVIAVAEDGQEAVTLAQRLKPDVILMDIHLPKMDGFAATRSIMEICPTRIVMITATSNAGDIAASFQALESGALTVLSKPTGIGHADHQRLATDMLRTVKLMSEVQVIKRWVRPRGAMPDLASSPPAEHRGDIRVIAIGASTGGPLAVREILAGLPRLGVPILIVQHISSGFIDGFVEWLESATGYAVKLALHGEAATPGIAYVAPDGRHMAMQADGRIALHLDPPEHGMRPAVSCLFRSISANFGAHAVGILLTGMGADGAQELGIMRQAGAVTFAQDRESSVVYGMPGEAARLNAATHILAPERIASTLTQLVKPRAG